MSTPPHSPLPLHTLGSTGLLVHPLCIGSAELGNMPETFAYEVAEEQAFATLHAIFDGPINFLDTAASYGDGESERRIGVVLRQRGGLPDGFVLATKADRDLQTNDFSGGQMRRSVERSLLGLDSLQLVYLHDPEHGDADQILGPGGAMEALARIIHEIVDWGPLRYGRVVKRLTLARRTPCALSLPHPPMCLLPRLPWRWKRPLTVDA